MAVAFPLGPPDAGHQGQPDLTTGATISTDLVPSDAPRRPSSRSTATPARRVDAMRAFEKSTDELENLKFERADWTSFRTVADDAGQHARQRRSVGRRVVLAVPP
jgi:hypothetical protein